MRQIITSIIVSVILLNVLFTSKDLTTKLIVIPFIVFAISLGIKNILIMLNKKSMAVTFYKIYTVAFLLYWFGFLAYWDYISFIDGKYLQILFSVPLWLGGFYFTYKRLIKKKF